MPNPQDLLKIRNLKKHFTIAKGFFFQKVVGTIRAVDGVDLNIGKGETVGLVGESGSGKSTLAGCIVRLEKPTEGEVLFEGNDLSRLEGEKLRNIRQHIQMIFQDPYSCLNPRMKVGNIVGEPLRVFKLAKGREIRNKVADLLDTVGLDPRRVKSYPHEFSGGQRQRIGIARALALNPKLVIADEPVSALDVSIQAQILNLMKRLQDRLQLTFLFISHDLGVVRHISDRIAVMYLGKIVEIGSSEDVCKAPLHPYTQALISAVPSIDSSINKKKSNRVVKDEIPSPLNPPSGCSFHARCPLVMQVCEIEEPILKYIDDGRIVSCHYVESKISIEK